MQDLLRRLKRVDPKLFNRVKDGEEFDISIIRDHVELLELCDETVKETNEFCDRQVAELEEEHRELLKDLD